MADSADAAIQEHDRADRNRSARKSCSQTMVEPVRAGDGQPEAALDGPACAPAESPTRRNPACPICGERSLAFDVLDFNRSCEEARGFVLPLSLVPIYYHRCEGCGFCFAPEMCAWPQSLFAERVYNQDYRLVDPDYEELRPRNNAGSLLQFFPDFRRPLRHVDFGGGSGRLAEVLSAIGWDSTTYDPFTTPDLDPASLGRFDLLTAFEVFEHTPDPQTTMQSIASMLSPQGLALVTTLLSDGEIAAGHRLTWWYAAPRNGHVSLYSQRALATLANAHDLKYGKASQLLHVLYRSPVPDWARHIFPEGA